MSLHKQMHVVRHEAPGEKCEGLLLRCSLELRQHECNAICSREVLRTLVATKREEISVGSAVVKGGQVIWLTGAHVTTTARSGPAKAGHYDGGSA